MTIEQACIDWLISLDATAGRVYPSLVPDEAVYPAAVVAALPVPVEYSHDGPDDLQRAKMQVSCWAASYADAKTLQRAIADEAETFYGDDSISVQAAFAALGPDLYDSNAKLHHHIVELTVWYEQLTPGS